MKRLIVTLLVLLGASAGSARYWENVPSEIRLAPENSYPSSVEHCIEIYQFGKICGNDFVYLDIPDIDATLESCTYLYQYGSICNGQFVQHNISVEPVDQAIALSITGSPDQAARGLESDASLSNYPVCSLQYSFGQYCNDQPFIGLTADGCQNKLNPEKMVDFCRDFGE